MSVKYKKIEKLKTRIKDLKTLKYAFMLNSEWKKANKTNKKIDKAKKKLNKLYPF